MRIFRLIFPFFFVLALAACSNTGGESENTPSAEAGEKGVLQVGVTGMSYPHSFRDGDEIVGYDYDVIAEAAKRAGYTVEYQAMNFPGLMGAVNAGRLDTVASNVTWTEERNESYVFSVPYAYDGVGLFTAAGNDELTTIDQLDGKVIATGAGSTNEIAVNNWIEENGYSIEVRTFDSAQAASTESAMGRVDADARPYGAGVAQIEFQGMELKPLEGPLLTSEQTRFPFQNTPEGRQKAEDISNALKEMKADGTLAEISQKYFGYDRSAYSDEYSTPNPDEVTTPGGN